MHLRGLELVRNVNSRAPSEACGFRGLGLGSASALSQAFLSLKCSQKSAFTLPPIYREKSQFSPPSQWVACDIAFLLLQVDLMHLTFLPPNAILLPFVSKSLTKGDVVSTYTRKNTQLKELLY